jgi:predicted transcriptional regulator
MNVLYKPMGNSDEKPEWLTEMDLEILEVLESELTLTPSIIGENIDRSRAGVSQRLNSLQAGGLVEKVDRGKYRITIDGYILISDKDRDEIDEDFLGYKTADGDRD